MRRIANYTNLHVAPLPLLPPPPEITLVEITNVNGADCDIEVTSDGVDGTVWVVLLLATAEPPTRAQIKAGTDGDDVAAIWAGSTEIDSIDTYNIIDGPTGLTDAPHIAYAVHEDAGGNASGVEASETFVPPFDLLALFDGFAGFWFDWSRTDLTFRFDTDEQNIASNGNEVQIAINRAMLGEDETLDEFATALSKTAVAGWVNHSYDVFSALGDDVHAEKTTTVAAQYFHATAGDAAGETSKVYVTDINISALNSRVSFGFRSGTTARSSVVGRNAPGNYRQYHYGTGSGTALPSFSTGTSVLTSMDVASCSWAELPNFHATQSTSSARPSRNNALSLSCGAGDFFTTRYFASTTANSLVARVTVPASIATTIYIMGQNDTGPSGRLYLGFNTSGHLIGGVGALDPTTIVKATDYRGQTKTFALRHDADSWHLDVDGVEVATGALASAPATDEAFRLFANNNNGTPTGFFEGGVAFHMLAIKRFLTETQSLQIHQEWTT